MVGCKKSTKVKVSREDRIFYFTVNVVLCAVFTLIAVPLLYVLAASFSSPAAVVSGRVYILPVEFSLAGYRAVFENDSIMRGFLNSVFYVVLGTAINVTLTVCAAYPLSRQDMPGGGFIMMLFSFTMIFSGGMIPTYMLMSRLHLLNTVGAMVISGAVSVYNMIITRTFFRSNIPRELLEASQIDGCSDFVFFLRIALPLSKAIIAVITLYYAIAHWNDYFNAFLYLTNKKLFPLQIILREILIVNQINGDMIVDAELMEAKEGLSELLKYSLIVVSVIPVLIIYPFVQRYFVKGIMIGSIKG